MRLRKALEIAPEKYEATKQILIEEGLKISEHFHGSKRVLYSQSKPVGFLEVDHYLNISEELSNKEFSSFLAAFTLSLHNELRKNRDLWTVRIPFPTKSTSDKNQKAFDSVPEVSKFYQIDISSAYWQMAYKIGYISKGMFNKYMFDDKYKEAKRYCISFLGRENFVQYHDGRLIDIVHCDQTLQRQIYENIRNMMYKVIQYAADQNPDWIMYHADSISVMQKDLENVKNIFDELSLHYKVNEVIKVDQVEYCINGKFKKF